MKRLLTLALLLSLGFAKISISPNYARITSNESLKLTVHLAGEPGMRKIKLSGPYLSWQEKKVWVGQYGKDISVKFNPEAEGEYKVRASSGEESSDMEVEVYKPESKDNLKERIEEVKAKVDTKEERELLQEVQHYYNTSRYEMAKMKLNELKEIIGGEKAPKKESLIPKLILIVVVGIAFFASTQFLFK